MSIGLSPEQWRAAEAALRGALQERGLPFLVDAGGGAFYGPKIDIKIKDSLGRAWQCTTIQFDFNLPERFDMIYVGQDGKEHRPYMIHRALLGSIERFFGESVARQLQDAGLRVEIDDSKERMGAKIREAQLQKIPYMLIIGDKEQAGEAVSVRLRSGEDLGPQQLDTLIARMRDEVAGRDG